MNIREIAEFLQTHFSGDGTIEINRVAALDTARENEISFLEKADALPSTAASCLLVPENFAAPLPCSLIKIPNPKLAFAKSRRSFIP